MGRPPRPDLHDALLDAARAEFARRGLERARVEDVARRAGASKGAFYLHFRSKEAVLEELLQRFYGAMEDQARGRQQAEERFQRELAALPPGERYARQLDFDCSVDEALLETLWRNREVLAVIEAAGATRLRRGLTEFRLRMHAWVAARMAEKQAAGSLRADLDPAVLGDVLVGTYEYMARRMMVMAERPDFRQWTRSFLMLLYQGLGAPAAPLPGPVPAAHRPARAPRAARRR